ncbi:MULTISPECIES: hypothetical protein [unclassified Spirosoma]|uniref:hypothetical protein n=1 Tax=unclassified Spirosoma TaxID=2621999 RepID=UPI0009602DD9|nr:MULTISPECIES: hypothetical protein [unclassified Spirosoma]MBN8824497.1 hypothetical protein [Spirosoma sp.]OJW70869.1 MAG: hypothetical protein BGO59_32075 [Spirosoma sp. 48-14]
MKTLLLLLLSTCLLGLSVSYAQRKTANRTIDEVLTDYIRAVETHDTTLLADCFHSSVFPLFETTRQGFANQIFTSINKIGFTVHFERAPYQSIKKEYTVDQIAYQSLGVVWKASWRVKAGSKDGPELKKMAEIYRSMYKNMQEVYQLTYNIPADVELVSLNEKKGELVVLQPETNLFVYEKSKREWRMVPRNYSALQMMSAASSTKPKTTKKR